MLARPSVMVQFEADIALMLFGGHYSYGEVKHFGALAMLVLAHDSACVLCKRSFFGLVPQIVLDQDSFRER